ncbi:MAG: hypothetical protein NZM15_10355 [Flavobacteriales bacterium]|nr:hypothetical protein [Flavobacteriales bacterium]MDW8433085.1 hypothetical protein [Flavobacteriales bacterium]
MDAGYISALILALLACSVKFAIAYPTAILTFGFSLPEAVLFGLTGGGLGVVAFTYAGALIINFAERIQKSFRPAPSPRKKKVFSKNRRRIVRVKQKFGLWGIALLSPVLISIPIGCLVAVRFFRHRGRIVKTMMTAVLLWSILMAAFRDAFLALIHAF